MKSQSTKPALTPPAQMQEANSTVEALMKCSLHANDLVFQIKESEARTTALKAQLAEVRKHYTEMKPKVLGVLAALDAP